MRRKEVRETEEEAVVMLDLQDENQTTENDQSVLQIPEKMKAEIKRQPFFLKRVIERVKGKLLEWWDILGEDEYGEY